MILLLLVSVILTTGYLLIPSATITITPSQQRLDAEATINATVDPEGVAVDVENGVIPATIVRAQIEQRGSVPTSGSQTLTGGRATGSVVFINKTNGAVNVPGGTTLSTSAGTPIQFRTIEDAAVPAGVGLQLEVPVEATGNSSGDVGNVAPGMINVINDAALIDQLEVRNVASTVGGTSRSVGIVTQDDHDRLIAILRQQLQESAYNEMLPRVEDNQHIIPETIHISEERSDWMTFDHVIGDAADSLSLTMRVVVEATVVDEGLAQQVAFARLAGQIPRGHVVRPESILYDRGAVTNVDSVGSVQFTMKCSGLVVSQIDSAQLQQTLAGRDPTDAAQYLVNEIDLADGMQPQIAISPDWMTRLPLLPMRITIHTASAAAPSAADSAS